MLSRYPSHIQSRYIAPCPECGLLPKGRPAPSRAGPTSQDPLGRNPTSCPVSAATLYLFLVTPSYLTAYESIDIALFMSILGSHSAVCINENDFTAPNSMPHYSQQNPNLNGCYFVCFTETPSHLQNGSGYSIDRSPIMHHFSFICRYKDRTTISLHARVH